MDSQTWREWSAQLTRKYRIPSLSCAFYGAGELHLAQGGSAGTSADSAPLPAPFASLTKLFTATVAMQLVTDGDLGLDEPVATHLPQLAHPAQEMTLRHLLSHSSGLVCDPPHDEGLRAAVARGPLFEPGTAFSYSNAAFAVVGRLIEAVTTLTWRTAVTDFLLRPLEIRPSFLDDSLVPRDLAPAAALSGHVGDLVTFARLHLRERTAAHAVLLEEDAVRSMAEAPFGTVPFGLADAWGLGWGIYGHGEERWLGLDGAGAGGTCHLRVQPERGYVLAVQAGSAAGGAAWESLVAMLRAEGVDIGMHAPDLPDDAESVLPDCAGRWTNGVMTYRISERDGAEPGTAVLEDDDGTEYRLTARGVRFFAARQSQQPGVEHPGRFLLDPVTGRAEHMQFGGRVMRRAA